MTNGTSDPHPPSAQLARLGAGDLGRMLDAGETTSVDIVSLLLERQEAIDGAGPELRSVLRRNERALDEAAALDAERPTRVRGPLHGVPLLVKDNIDTADLGATAGSTALAGASPAADAPLIAVLRQAGAIIIGKASLSEWAHFRGRPMPSGWCALGRQGRNPFALDRSPGGSSSGSGAGVAAGLAPLAVGTETDGSILCPSAACGLVGIKPTVGLVSRQGVVPISASQDTAGPMARSVADAAMLLAVLATAPETGPAVVAGRPANELPLRIDPDGRLEGVRLGLVRDPGYCDYHLPTDRIIEDAAEALRAAGAEVIDPVTGVGAAVPADETIVLCTEFKAGLNAYLAARAAGAGSAGASLPRSIDDVIAHNERDPSERLDLFPQDLLVRSAGMAGLDDPAYQAALAANHRRTRSEGIDAVCDRLRLDALLAPTMAPAWLIDHVNGDAYQGSAWGQPAIAGYPSLTLPVGAIHGLPVGLAIWGRAWSEATLVRIAAALERQLDYRPVPAYTASTAVPG